MKFSPISYDPAGLELQEKERNLLEKSINLLDF
jgi:hypothetical protein